MKAQSGPANKSDKSTQGGRSQDLQAEGMESSKLMKLFEDELKDIYWVEKALVKALPKMLKNATSPELAAAIQSHLQETEEQVKKVEAVFAAIGKTPKAKPCEAMKGILEEGAEMMKEADKGSMRDAVIIASAQKVEHYEIASYGTLAAFAGILGEEEAAEILNQILAEEKAADETLTQVAMTAVNITAAMEQEDEEEGTEKEEDKEELGADEED